MFSLDKSIATLNEAEKELFERFSMANNDLSGMLIDTSFVNGYKLGVLMTVEVFSEE